MSLSVVVGIAVLVGTVHTSHHLEQSLKVGMPVQPEAIGHHPQMLLVKVWFELVEQTLPHCPLQEASVDTNDIEVLEGLLQGWRKAEMMMPVAE